MNPLRKARNAFIRWWVNPVATPSQIGKVTDPDKYRPIPIECGYTLHADGVVYRMFRDARGHIRMKGIPKPTLDRLENELDRAERDGSSQITIRTDDLRALINNDQPIIDMVRDEYQQLVALAEKEMREAGTVRGQLRQLRAKVSRKRSSIQRVRKS